jgi:hypothetical protein
LIFDPEYLIRVQSSEPLHAKMNPTSCLLMDDGIFYLQAAIQRTIDVSRIYGVRFGEKDRGLTTCKP